MSEGTYEYTSPSSVNENITTPEPTTATTPRIRDNNKTLDFFNK